MHFLTFTKCKVGSAFLPYNISLLFYVGYLYNTKRRSDKLKAAFAYEPAFSLSVGENLKLYPYY